MYSYVRVQYIGIKTILIYSLIQSQHKVRIVFMSSFIKFQHSCTGCGKNQRNSHPRPEDLMTLVASLRLFVRVSTCCMSELTDKPDPEGLDLQHKYEKVYQTY